MFKYTSIENKCYIYIIPKSIWALLWVRTSEPPSTMGKEEIKGTFSEPLIDYLVQKQKLGHHLTNQNYPSPLLEKRHYINSIAYRQQESVDLWVCTSCADNANSVGAEGGSLVSQLLQVFIMDNNNFLQIRKCVN